MRREIPNSLVPGESKQKLILAQRCKMAMPKMWWSPIFEKKIFPAENAGKPGFWHFLEISSLVFSIFLHKDAYSNAHDMVESNSFTEKAKFWWNYITLNKALENLVHISSRFRLIFSAFLEFFVENFWLLWLLNIKTIYFWKARKIIQF